MLIPKILVAIFIIGFLCACNNSIILSDTHGMATDVIDDTKEATTDFKPALTIPATPL